MSGKEVSGKVDSGYPVPGMDVYGEVDSYVFDPILPPPLARKSPVKKTGWLATTETDSDLLMNDLRESAEKLFSMATRFAES